jgi:signal-transduction protein with cAMP-binding, CBS, and nucleotidyltransferase domain
MSEDRAADDLEIVHNYMMSTNEFLHKLSAMKPKHEMYKLYKALSLCKYHQDDNIMRFGEPGDTFYIILEGEVGVKVPADH